MDVLKNRETRRDFREFLDLLQEFSHAMLVTCDLTGKLRSRPMAIAESTDDGHLWFITHVDGETLEQMTENPQVNASLQDGKRFLAISGTARATRDPDRIRALWTEDQRVWFEKGQDDPTLILIEVVPTFAEYWDRSGLDGIKFRLEELRAIVSGDTLTGEEGRHGTVDFPDVASPPSSERKSFGR